ncbi:hypothetical protein ILUMI_07696 [Ignelater luminosus]|uniref:Tc1-like transposase DDE domain-containing protein n=1 Tax=Ignelater luminosus TaxID=2038154 RepID=A0A8K0D3D6_IGNLU|nr:hypothetical protein ILUMI_07696 [Ignelater luminosus]
MPRQMGQSECSMEIRGRIAALAKAVWSISQIAQTVDLSRRTVKRGILSSQLGELDTVRPGAAYITNANQDNAIVEMAYNSRFISTVRIRETLQLKTCMTSKMFYQEEPAGIVRVTPPRFNSRQYIRVLEAVLLPSVRAVYPEDEMATFIFVQDNSSIHTAKIVQEWFEEHPEIELLLRPAKSTDLNPIKNLWTATVREWDNIEFHRVRERNLKELTRHATTTWESLRNFQICDNLRHSMQRSDYNLAACRLPEVGIFNVPDYTSNYWERKYSVS